MHAERVVILSLAVTWAAVCLSADIVYLKDGDRVTGQVSVSGKAHRIITPYGRLLLPDGVIDKIVYADGREETLATPPPPATPTPPPNHIDLLVTITGDSFWLAWDPREVPEDPTLRLVVHLDGRPVAAYLDAVLDPDIPGATVNAFAFDPTQTRRIDWQGAKALAPEITPGKVRLAIELPLAKAGGRHLRLSYQTNVGSAEAPEWRDLQQASLDVVLDPAAPTAVRIEQSRGQMSFAKRRMQKPETFRLQMLLDHEYKAAPATGDQE